MAASSLTRVMLGHARKSGTLLTRITGVTASRKIKTDAPQALEDEFHLNYLDGDRKGTE